MAKELCFSNNYNTVEPPFATTSCKMTTFWPGVFIDFHCFLKTLESDHLRHDVVSLCTVCVTPITVYEELLVTAWNYPYTQLRNSSNKFFAKIIIVWVVTYERFDCIIITTVDLKNSPWLQMYVLKISRMECL